MYIDSIKVDEYYTQEELRAKLYMSASVFHALRKKTNFPRPIYLKDNRAMGQRPIKAFFKKVDVEAWFEEWGDKDCVTKWIPKQIGSRKNVGAA